MCGNNNRQRLNYFTVQGTILSTLDAFIYFIFPTPLQVALFYCIEEETNRTSLAQGESR